MLSFASIRLVGSHIVLEPLGDHHLDPLFQASTESRDTYRFTSVPENRQKMAEYLQTAFQLRDQKKALPFAVLDVAKNKVIGTTRFANIEFWHSESTYPSAAEIGWTWLCASAQRTYANTEMKTLMLTHAFETWKVKRVKLSTDSRNERSRRAIERIGAKLDGILRADMIGFDGQLRHSAYYSILLEEWSDVQKHLKKLSQA